MNASTEYIKQLLETDHYDSEFLLELRDKYFQPEESVSSEPLPDRYDAESEVTDLSDNFWETDEEETAEKISSLMDSLEKLNDLKQHLIKLEKINTLRPELLKLGQKTKLNQTFIKDFKELLPLKGHARQAFELKVYENIKDSSKQLSVKRSIKTLKKEFPELAEYHSDWLHKILEIRSHIKHEKKAEKKSNYDWIWVIIGIYFILRFIMRLVK
jgi:hypothetical protein